jgi:anti-anti-sigma factor
MTSSKIHTATVGINTVVTIKESLIYKSCGELEKVYNQLYREGKNRIVLDYRAVPFLDSQALELLYAIHEALGHSGGILRIFGLNATCRDIFAATRLINIFHVYGDMSEALRGDA